MDWGVIMQIQLVDDDKEKHHEKDILITTYMFEHTVVHP